MTLCAMIVKSRDNPRITIPAELNGVSVQVQRIGNRLVFLVRGFSIMGAYMFTREVIRKSLLTPAALLLRRTTTGGMIEHDWSDSFDVTNTVRKGEILNNNNSIIALTHPNVDRLERNVIQNVPGYGCASATAGGANNRAYKLANTPGFYIDNIRYNSLRQVRPIIGGNNTAVRTFLNDLKEQFRELRSSQPVEGTLNDVRVICKLASM